MRATHLLFASAAIGAGAIGAFVTLGPASPPLSEFQGSSSISAPVRIPAASQSCSTHSATPIR